jgi:hypothetical protein
MRTSGQLVASVNGRFGQIGQSSCRGIYHRLERPIHWSCGNRIWRRRHSGNS